MSQTLSQRRTLHEYNSENKWGEVFAGFCVIAIPFLLWFIGAAFV